MAVAETGSEELRDRFVASQRVARQLADACFAAWGTINVSAPGFGRPAALIMDCSYVASATARLLAHADQYRLDLLAINLVVCERVARQCAVVCDAQPGPTMVACANAALEAARAFEAVLTSLWDAAVTIPPSELPGILAPPDGDESTYVPPSV
jgi:hypothetical protein